jgi:hypothetical protein
VSWAKRSPLEPAKVVVVDDADRITEINQSLRRVVVAARARKWGWLAQVAADLEWQARELAELDAAELDDSGETPSS